MLKISHFKITGINLFYIFYQCKSNTFVKKVVHIIIIINILEYKVYIFPIQKNIKFCHNKNGILILLMKLYCLNVV